MGSRRIDHDHYSPPKAPVDLGPLFGGEPAPAPVTHVVEVRAHLRTVAGERPPTGAERRDAALANQEAREASAKALAYVRAKLADLYRSRVRANAGTQGVTADDADRILKEWPHFPRELAALPKQNWRGAIFNPRDWEKTGASITATRGHLNGTSLPLWRLRAQEARSA